LIKRLPHCGQDDDTVGIVVRNVFFVERKLGDNKKRGRGLIRKKRNI
jgi:hypothetical protein